MTNQSFAGFLSGEIQETYGYLAHEGHEHGGEQGTEPHPTPKSSCCPENFPHPTPKSSCCDIEPHPTPKSSCCDIEPSPHAKEQLLRTAPPSLRTTILRTTMLHSMPAGSRCREGLGLTLTANDPDRG